MPNRKQRQARRRANRVRRKAKFQQSAVYQAFHKEKPKGSRGYQVISKSKAGGLTGKLGLKEKVQDLFTKDGHQGCPSWGIDKDGNKVCTSGDGGSTKTTGNIGNKKITVSDPDEKKKGLDFSFPKFVANLSMGFKNREHNAMTPYSLSSAGSKKEWRREEKRPMRKLGIDHLAFEDWRELNRATVMDRMFGPKEGELRLDKSIAKANEPTKDGVTDKEKEKSQRNENHFEISVARVKSNED